MRTATARFTIGPSAWRALRMRQPGEIFVGRMRGIYGLGVARSFGYRRGSPATHLLCARAPMLLCRWFAGKCTSGEDLAMEGGRAAGPSGGALADEREPSIARSAGNMADPLGETSKVVHTHIARLARPLPNFFGRRSVHSLDFEVLRA